MISMTVDRNFQNTLTPLQQRHLMSTIKAVIYARVSTQDQANHGYSLESQVDRSVELASTRYGISRDEIIAVIEQGEMGDDPNRPALHLALWLIEQGIGTKLIVFHPDRLARDLKLQLFITERVWNAGCEISFVEMEVDPNNPESLLLYNIQGAIAQYNKAKILANSKRGRRTKAMNGKIPGVRRVYGYSFDKEEDTLVVNREERDVYLMMVDWMLFGKEGHVMNFTSIAKELSLLGISAPCGDKWYQATVSRIMKNPVYTGTYYYGKTEYRQKSGRREIVKKASDEWQMIRVPSYIDRETFDALQSKIRGLAKRGRGAKPQTNYLLKGLARCGRCGAAVVAGPSSRDKKTGEPVYHYYTCSGKGRKIFEVGTGRQVHACRGRNWRQDIVDHDVWRYVVQCLQKSEPVLEQIWNQRDDAQGRKALELKRDRCALAIREKQSERKRWLHLAVKGRVTEAELDECLSSLEKQIGALEGQLQRMDRELEMRDTAEAAFSDTREVIANFYRYLERGMEEADRKKLVDLLVERVVLRDHEIAIYPTWHDANTNID